MIFCRQSEGEGERNEDLDGLARINKRYCCYVSLVFPTFAMLATFVICPTVHSFFTIKLPETGDGSLGDRNVELVMYGGSGKP
ncbi:MAG TPA: hypothetical protein DD990_35190 [Cyanobacteria bacterium UBA11368]|nr:hypothetical protein [Cyanobacteria bacterium UBA11368]